MHPGRAEDGGHPSTRDLLAKTKTGRLGAFFPFPLLPFPLLSPSLPPVPLPPLFFLFSPSSSSPPIAPPFPPLLLLLPLIPSSSFFCTPPSPPAPASFLLKSLPDPKIKMDQGEKNAAKEYWDTPVCSISFLTLLGKFLDGYPYQTLKTSAPLRSYWHILGGIHLDRGSPQNATGFLLRH